MSENSADKLKSLQQSTGESSSSSDSSVDNSRHDVSAEVDTAREEFSPTLAADDSLPACQPTEARPPAEWKDAFGESGEYELLQELGRGGMGVVFKARDLRANRIVALKMMLGGRFASPNALRRFQIEAEATASLDHPNIVPIYHVGEIDGTPYFTMRYIEGTDLDNHERYRGAANPKEAAALIRQVALAVQFAHARGILHRDLKPANILIDKDGEPHITDFGLAKKIDEDQGQTQSGAVLGTPDYMSPEQAAGLTNKVSVASDVYSLGSILFDLLTGDPPFRSETMMQTLIRVTKEPARLPGMFQRQIGPDLEVICLKCLEKSPEQRFQSAQELADELDRYLHGIPIVSRPVGKVEHVQRWCRRNPVVATLAGSVLVMLVAWLVGMNLALVQISHQRDLAQTAREAAERNEQVAISEQLRADENSRVAEKARDLARYNEAIAHQTLYDVVNVFQDRLSDRPGLQDLRQSLLEMVLERLEGVDQAEARIKDDVNSVDLATRAAAGAHQRGGSILLQMGLIHRALDKFRSAMELVEQMDQSSPANPVNKQNMAACCNNLADAYRRLGLLASTRDYYQQGLAYREQRVELLQRANANKWAVINGQWDAAFSCVLLSKTALALGDPETAQRYMQDADRWAAAVPADAEFSQLKDYIETAAYRAAHGDLLRSLSDTSGAQQQYERAIDVLQKGLKKLSQESVRLQGDSCEYYLSLGDLFAYQLDDLLKGHEYYLLAEQTAKQLRDRDPRNVAVARILGAALYRLGTLAASEGRKADSDEYFARCLKLRADLSAQSPEDVPLRIELMLVLARSGQVSEAMDIAGKILEEVPEPIASYAAARCYAVCLAIADLEESNDDGQRDAFQRRAVEALQRALESGWRDLVSMRADPDFVSVRNFPPLATP